MKITLVGYMGSGKSRFAEELAGHYQLRHFDLDEEIEKETGYTIAETFFNKGELYFRKLERAKLQALLKFEDAVIATGGGTPCYYDNMQLINKASLSVYLQASVNTLYERLKNQRAERPLLAHLADEKLKEFIAKHLFERAAFYEQATVILPETAQSAEARLKQLNEYLG